MIDIDKALASPAAVFSRPEEVVEAKELTLEQRVQVLRQWSYDLRELAVATDENMEATADTGGQAEMLARVDGLLRDLDPHAADRSAPTRQGGV